MVGDREHHDTPRFGEIEHAIRIPLHRRPTGFAVDAGVHFGLIPDGGESGIHSANEVFSQARSLPFIPGICGYDITSCLRADLKSERLRRFALPALVPGQAPPSTCALTSSHDTLVSGCAR